MSGTDIPLRKGPSGPKAGFSGILTKIVVPSWGVIPTGQTGTASVPAPFPPGSIADGDIVAVSLTGITILPLGTAIAYTRVTPAEDIEIGLFNGGPPIGGFAEPMSIAVIKLVP